jgi:nitroreductase
MIDDLIRRNRSYRRFHENEPVNAETLKDLVNLARLSASAGNLQPLKYLLANDPATCGLIFPCLKWAGYLLDWDGPQEGERPPAYIIVLGDTSISKDFSCDHGIAAQSILLGAVERGLGGCIVGSINRPRLMRDLGIASHLDVLIAIALGRPAETVVIESVEDEIRYWRDTKGVHHVPKRALEDIVILPDI